MTLLVIATNYILFNSFCWATIYILIYILIFNIYSIYTANGQVEFSKR